MGEIPSEEMNLTVVDHERGRRIKEADTLDQDEKRNNQTKRSRNGETAHPAETMSPLGELSQRENGRDAESKVRHNLISLFPYDCHLSSHHCVLWTMNLSGHTSVSSHSLRENINPTSINQ